MIYGDYACGRRWAQLRRAEAGIQHRHGDADDQDDAGDGRQRAVLQRGAIRFSPSPSRAMMRCASSAVIWCCATNCAQICRVISFALDSALKLDASEYLIMARGDLHSSLKLYKLLLFFQFNLQYCKKGRMPLQPLFIHTFPPYIIINFFPIFNRTSGTSPDFLVRAYSCSIIYFPVVQFGTTAEVAITAPIGHQRLSDT